MVWAGGGCGGREGVGSFCNVVLPLETQHSIVLKALLWLGKQVLRCWWWKICGVVGVKCKGFGIVILHLTPAQHGAGSIAVFGGPGWWDGEFGQELGQGLHLLYR